MANLKFLQVPAEFNTVGLSVVWIIVGLIAIYAGIKNLLDKENPSRIGTAAVSYTHLDVYKRQIHVTLERMALR